MELLPPSLTAAALSAREGLARAARRAAAPAQADPRGAATGAAMAAAARTAIFADALLGVLRARLEELRAATR